MHDQNGNPGSRRPRTARDRKASPAGGLTLRLAACAGVSALPFLAASGAWAQAIDDTVTEPVRSSTINEGNPGDVVITADGEIVLEDTDGVVAVTMDTSHDFTNDGEISINESDNATGVRIEANLTGNIVNNGDITIREDYERTDTDDDDDLDGPFAVGTGRVGILFAEGGVHTGNLVLGAGSLIDVEGNESAGVRLLSDLMGSVTVDGNVTVLGTNSTALDLQGQVSGDVLVSSTVTAVGEGAKGVVVGDGIDGALTIEAEVRVTGYTSTTNSNYIPPGSVTDDTPPVEERLDPDDLLIGGPAVVIGGSLGSGLLINGDIDQFVSDEEAADETKDTIEDYDENRSTGGVFSFGSAPAIDIAPDLVNTPTGDLVLGPVVEKVRDTLDDDDDDDVTEVIATFTYDHGLINRGVIAARGLNVGVDSVAVRIAGSADGAFDTVVTGGFLNAGSISASSAVGNATGVSFLDGANIGTLTNTGTITAANATTVAGPTVTGVFIGEGATVNTIVNDNSIVAASEGYRGTARGIVDESGTLTSITNRGLISASQSQADPDPDDDVLPGPAIAIDARNHGPGAGLTITQERRTPVEDINGDDEINEEDVPTPGIVGDILLGAGDDTLSVLAGTIRGDTDFGLGDDTLALGGSTYIGDVSFEGGTDTFTLDAASFTGDASFTGGTAMVSLTNGAVFRGNLVNDGASLALSLAGSSLYVGSNPGIMLDSLSVTGESLIEFTVDPLADLEDPYFTVAGMASIGPDTMLRPVFSGIIADSFSTTIIEAGDLSFSGTLDDSQIDNIPFIYDVTLSVEEGATDTLRLDFGLKTAEALGLDVNQANAYGAVLEVFADNADLGAALAAITGEEEFSALYGTLLPQRTDAALRFLDGQANASLGALNDRLDLIQLTGGDGSRAWAQEFFSLLDIDSNANVPGYDGSGFGFATGYDRPLLGLDAVGVMAVFTSGRFEETNSGRSPVSTTGTGFGVYAQETIGMLDLRASGMVTRTSFDSDRLVSVGDTRYEIIGDWKGWSQTASVSATLDMTAGSWYMRPRVSAEYFGLDQDAYTETGASVLTVNVGEASSDRTTASGSLTLGGVFDLNNQYGGFFSPEITAGVRTAIDSTPYEAVSYFEGYDTPFTLTSLEDYSDSVFGGVSLRLGIESFSVNIGYDVEVMEEGLAQYGGVTIRAAF